MKFKKLMIILLVLSIILVSALACDQNGNESKPDGTGGSTDKGDTNQDEVIRIGVFEPVTGASAGGGALEVEGFELAHSLRPELNGKKVELYIADNKSDKVEAAIAATKLVEKDKVQVILGSYGSALTMAAGDVAKQAGIPLITATSTNPLVTEGNEYAFRLCFIDTFQGEVMAVYAARDLGYKKIGVLRELNNDFCVGLASFFTKTFTDYTGDPNSVVTADFNTGDQDFSSQLTMIMQNEPDALFVPCPSNFADVALMMKQLHQLGHDIPLLGSDGYEVHELIEIGGADVEGIIYTTFFDTGADLTPATRKFLDMYEEKYNKEPSAMTVLAFDAYNLALDTIERVGSDPAAIRQGLVDTDEWEGVGGYVTFDENRNASKPAVIKKIEGGKFVYVATVSADE